MQALILLSLLCCVPQGLSLMIDTPNPSLEIEEGTPLTVVCYANDTDVNRTGQIDALSIASVSRRQVSEYVRQYPGASLWRREMTTHSVMTSVVKLERSGQLVWGEGFAERSTASGTTKPKFTALSLTINSTRCNDGPSFVCVARGRKGTVDSQQAEVNIVPVPRKVTILGGRRWSGRPRDNCDVYSTPRDKVDLTCTASVSHSLSTTPVTWYKDNGKGNQVLDSTDLLLQNSTSESCSVIIGRSVVYQHEASDDADVVTLTCSIAFSTPLTPNERTKSSSVTICTDSGGTSASRFTQDHIIGLFFAGVGAMLVLVLLTLIVVMCCCGYRCRDTKKDSVYINGDYPGK